MWDSPWGGQHAVREQRALTGQEPRVRLPLSVGEAPPR